MLQCCGGRVSPNIDRGDAASLHNPHNHRAQSRGLYGDGRLRRLDFRAAERSIDQMGRRLWPADARRRLVAPVVFGLRSHWGAASVAEYVVFVESGASGGADVRELDFP